MINIFKLFNYKDIDSICKKYDIKNYTINSDDSIDVDGNVYLSGKGLKKLPLKFRNVSGYFHCGYNQLTYLEGCPISVVGSFNCGNNKLSSLEGCPINIGGHFICDTNKLTSLEGSPKTIHAQFWCSNNQLTSLKGGPISVNNDFRCFNNKLTSLEGFPNNIGGHFYCIGNPITSLINSWINSTKRYSMLDYFNDLDIIRDNGKSIVLDRLEEFVDIFNIDNINLKLVEKYYRII